VYFISALLRSEEQNEKKLFFNMPMIYLTARHINIELQQ
jgi:hypothetical protein